MELSEKNPLLTFALFAYNQENYIEEAVLGAFSQTYTPLEIILSDDCSPDNTFTIMQKMVNEYKGPHKIILNKNTKNLGLIGHINKVFQDFVKGEIIVVAAGDDISFKNRVEKTYNVFKRFPSVYSVSMNHEFIDDRGKTVIRDTNYKNGFYKLKKFYKTKDFPRIGCSRAYRSEIISLFGKLTELYGIEDKILVFRALILGGIYHTDELGLKYRVNINSLSNVSRKSNYLDGTINQSLKDLQIAQESNILTNREVLKLKKILNSVRNNFYLRSKFYNSNSRITFYIMNILFSFDFNSREKLGLLKYILKMSLTF